MLVRMLLLVVGLLVLPSLASAEPTVGNKPAAPSPAAGDVHGAHGDAHAAHGDAHGAHGDAHAAHGDAHATEHGGAHDTGHHHEAPGKINWAQGFVGESDEGPYGFTYRPPGTPPPLLALLFNTAIVFLVLYFIGRAPVRQALLQRRTTILKGMEDAAKMKAEAEERLKEYEDRLAHLDDELERLKKTMRQQGKAERERILAEARAKREKMEYEAQRMVALELKAGREQMQAEAVQRAMAAAQALLVAELGSPDQRRLLDEHLADLAEARLGDSSVGGAA